MQCDFTTTSCLKPGPTARQLTVFLALYTIKRCFVPVVLYATFIYQSLHLKALQTAAMPHRSCAIEINNSSGCYTLANPRVFTESGNCEVPLPPMVGPCSGGNALFNKTTGAATGTVGVFTYDLFNGDLGDYSHIVAVMFSVPYDRNLYSNWFAVGIFDRGNNCDYNLYDTMYNGSENSFVRSKADGSCISFNGDYVTASASMSDSGESVLRLDISDTGMY